MARVDGGVIEKWLVARVAAHPHAPNNILLPFYEIVVYIVKMKEETFFFLEIDGR